jgi:hypothetical protein
MSAHEIKRALLIVWLIATVCETAILVSPFILTPQAISSMTPLCVSKTRYNRSCVLCGMTTAFLSMSKGDVRGALKHNRGSAWLYSAFVGNTTLALLLALRALCSRLRPGARLRARQRQAA